MAKKSPPSYDPLFWHNIQPPESMEISRKFEYDEDALTLLKKWLRLNDRVQTIIEVGPGSGFFTEKLLNMAQGAKIICIEPDKVLREFAAQKLPSVEFVKGTAENLLLPAEHSDLTLCHIVLNNLPDVPKAVAEMVRVTKKGGIVAAVEPIGRSVNYFPNPRLDKLNVEAGMAFGKGIWNQRMKTMDYSRDLKNKQARYPEIFRDCGLERVEAHGLLSVFLLSDQRRDLDQIREWLRERLDFFVKDKERSSIILERGGLEKDMIEEFHGFTVEYLEGLVENPELISETHELETVSRMVTVGFKPE